MSVRRAEHVEAEDVMLERSMLAKSARVDCGFYGRFVFNSVADGGEALTRM